MLKKEIIGFYFKKLVKMGQNNVKNIKVRFDGKCMECGDGIKTGKDILKNSKD